MKRLLALVALFFASPALSATYYVDCAASNDKGAGTSPETAWRTIDKVNRSGFSPGDSILFKRGCTWRETLTPPSSGSGGNPITFGAYGSGANPIINGSTLGISWTNYGGNVWQTALTGNAGGAWLIPAKAWFDGALGTRKASTAGLTGANQWYWASNVLYVYSASDPSTAYTNPGIEAANKTGIFIAKSSITVDGIDVTKANIGLHAYPTSANISNVSVLNGSFTYCGAEGVTLAGNTTSGYTFTTGLIQGVTAHDNGGSGVLLYSAKSATVERGKFYANGGTQEWAAGIRIYHEYNSNAGSNIIQYNECYSNTQVTAHYGGDGIHVDNAGDGNIVRYNSCHNNAQDGIHEEANAGTDDAYGLRIYGNICYGNFWDGIGVQARIEGGITNKATYVYNNSVYGNVNGITIFGNGSKNNVVMNNISVGNSSSQFRAFDGGENDGSKGFGNVYTYNCFGADASNFIEWGAGVYRSTYPTWEAAYGGRTYSVEADPRFANAPGDNFTLQSSSPCIDVGADLGPLFSTALMPGSSWPSHVLTADQYRTGQWWEIGAYLFPATTSGTPTPTPTPTATPTGTWTPPTPTPTATRTPNLTATPTPTFPIPTPTATSMPTLTPTPTPPPPPPPGGFTPSFTFSPKTPTQGQYVQFTDSSSGASAWNWDFGDGTRSTLRNPAHTYAARGIYTVALWVSSGVNWSKAEQTITVGGAGRVRRHLPVQRVVPRQPPRE